MCDRCQKDYTGYTYSIVMDAEGNNLTGNFCSLECSLVANRFIIANNRPIKGWENREKWTQNLFGNRLQDSLKKKK